MDRPEGQALVGIGKVAGEEVILAKPQTYMNLSGISVGELMDKYELEPEELLVMFDERDLPWGMIRIGERGSPGTHNGAKSVTSAVGTAGIRALAIGMRPGSSGRRSGSLCSAADEEERSGSGCRDGGKAGDAVELLLTQGIAAAMNKFNRRVPPPEV